MKLITLEEDFPIFNPEVRMIKEFRTIIERDKGSKGDASGRYKKLATKELAYVHFMSYYNSEFITSYSEDEREAKVIKHLDLPEGWKADVQIEYACLTYKALTNTPSMDALREAREALFSADKILKIYRMRLQKQLQEMDMEVTGDDEDENEKKIQSKLDSVDKTYSRIMEISKKMPDAMDTINKLEERVKKEMEGEMKGRGNKNINLQQLAD